ncbi:MAG: nucleotide exchange factor GrpE [Solirubrobacterales bacterium]
MTTAHNGEPEKVEAQDAQPAADPGTPGREAEEVPGGDSAAGGGSEVVDELEELVDGLRRERDEYLGLAQRAKADFENYRKRTAREAADAERRGKLALARDLVPSVDSLERAMAAADEGSDVARGLELVHGELVATLKRAGVESFDPVGERFDPAHSEAVSMQPASGVEAGVVVETLDRGYRSDGTVLRPARVIVAE